MKAVVLSESRQPQLTDLPIPEPGEGEVLVRSEYCGVCGSDLHASELDIFQPLVVMGHEFAGEIVALGAEATGWRVGDRVTINPNANVCGRCEYCRIGRYNLCHDAIFVNSLGVRRNGGMAEYVAVKTVHLHRLPEGLDTLRGAWTEPLAVAVRAVRNSGLRIGDHVGIIGAGPIGQLVLQLVRRGGAARVVLVEPSAFRRETAVRLGADEALTPDDLSASLSSNSFQPVNHVFECSGHPTALQTAIDMVAPGGSIRLIGASPKPATFTAMSALVKEITLTANFTYVDEFDIAVGLLARESVDVKLLTSAVVSLDDFGAAFAALRQPDQTIKALIRTFSAAPR